jgi:hypothetical protein
MLHYAEKNGLEDIVSWLPGGKGFGIHNHELFCSKVLKATFNHSNFKSFEKQLNNWNFTKESTVAGGKAYSNPNFMRGRKSLCQNMTSKSTRTKKPITTSIKSRSSSISDAGRQQSIDYKKEVLAAALLAAHQAAAVRDRQSVASLGSAITSGAGSAFLSDAGASKAPLAATTTVTSATLGIPNDVSSLALLNAIQNRINMARTGYQPPASSSSPADLLNHILASRKAHQQQLQHHVLLKQLEAIQQHNQQRQVALAQFLLAHQEQQENATAAPPSTTTKDQPSSLDDENEKAAALLALRVPR